MPIKDSGQRLEAIRRGSTHALAYGRTVMANERTLLAFLRTSIGLMGGGIGIVGLVKHPFIAPLGWFAILFVDSLIGLGSLAIQKHQRTFNKSENRDPNGR